MARISEQAFLASLVQAIETQRPPSSNDEADIFRFVAQLLKTRFPVEASALEKAAHAHFADDIAKPRLFPQIVEDGLLADVPRLRRAIENAVRVHLAKR